MKCLYIIAGPLHKTWCLATRNPGAYDKDWTLLGQSFSFANLMNFPLIVYSKLNLFGQIWFC